jgi:hypothetical protein
MQQPEERAIVLHRCVLICAVTLVSAAVLPLTAGAEEQTAFTTLAGLLPKVVEAEKGPYLIIADIEVPAGKLVTIEPGTVLLFKNFTGLHVQGRLVADGTVARPIVFTSEYDRDYNPTSTMLPNPYDWNGLYIHSNAIGSSLSNCKIFFSVYGIISETKFIRIGSGKFANNGKSNLVIENNEHVIGDAPYSYELSLKDATVDGVPIKILRDPAAPKRNTFRFGGIGVFLAGAGLGAYSTYQWIGAKEELDELSSSDSVNLVYHTGTEWEEKQKERNTSRILSLMGIGIGIIGAVGFGWSFTF